MARDDPTLEQLIHSVIGAFFEVYNILGHGLLEQLYVAALEHELRARGHRVAREVPVPVVYKGVVLGVQRLDLLVDRRLVVEAKSTAELHPAAKRQLHNYLRATRLPTGLLFHFGLEPRFYRLRCPGQPGG
jgi:GxxExxY protein